MSHRVRKGASNETLSCTHTGGALSNWVIEGVSDETLSCTHTGGALSNRVRKGVSNETLSCAHTGGALSNWVREGVSNETLSYAHTGGALSKWVREGVSNETLSCTHTGGALSKPMAHFASLDLCNWLLRNKSGQTLLWFLGFTTDALVKRRSFDGPATLPWRISCAIRILLQMAWWWCCCWCWGWLRARCLASRCCWMRRMTWGGHCRGGRWNCGMRCTGGISDGWMRGKWDLVSFSVNRTSSIAVEHQNIDIRVSTGHPRSEHSLPRCVLIPSFFYPNHDQSCSVFLHDWQWWFKVKIPFEVRRFLWRLDSGTARR